MEATTLPNGEFKVITSSGDLPWWSYCPTLWGGDWAFSVSRPRSALCPTSARVLPSACCADPKDYIDIMSARRDRLGPVLGGIAILGREIARPGADTSLADLPVQQSGIAFATVDDPGFSRLRDDHRLRCRWRGSQDRGGVLFFMPSPPCRRFPQNATRRTVGEAGASYLKSPWLRLIRLALAVIRGLCGLVSRTRGRAALDGS